MDKTTYINLLIDKSSEMDEKLQYQIIEFLFKTFVQYQKDTLYIYNGVIKKVKSKQAFLTMVKMTVNIEFNIDIMFYSKKAKKIKWLIKIDELYDTITTINSYEQLIYSSNLFANKQIAYTDDFTGVIKVITNKIHTKELEQINISNNDYNSIIKDYKEHFKYFDDFIDLIVDMRFAKDRKASFLHFRVRSDWGKSFLAGLLKNIEIGIEVDYHNLMNKSTNDISPIQVRNSYVLMIDEFNNFSQEMKKLSHSFTFAPKFGMSETVELYLKVLFSAENSVSFTGGVDEQIINRVMVFDFPDNETVKLIDREEYIYQGNAKYMKVLEDYTLKRILKRVDNYLLMEEMEAYKTADNRVRNFYSVYKMSADSLINNITDILNDTIKYIAMSDIDNLPKYYQDLKKRIFIDDETGQYPKKYVIQNHSVVFERILKNETNEKEYKKMSFKLTNIYNIVDVVDDRTKKKYKGQRRIIINIPTEKKEIPIIHTDKDNKIIGQTYMSV